MASDVKVEKTSLVGALTALSAILTFIQNSAVTAMQIQGVILNAHNEGRGLTQEELDEIVAKRRALEDEVIAGLQKIADGPVV